VAPAVTPVPATVPPVVVVEDTTPNPADVVLASHVGLQKPPCLGERLATTQMWEAFKELRDAKRMSMDDLRETGLYEHCWSDHASFQTNAVPKIDEQHRKFLAKPLLNLDKNLAYAQQDCLTQAQVHLSQYFDACKLEEEGETDMILSVEDYSKLLLPFVFYNY